MTDHTLFILDTETGGLDPNRHSLLSFSLIPWSLSKGVDTAMALDVLVNEGDIVAEPESLAVNGIDLNDVRRYGVPPYRAVEMVEQYLYGAATIRHGPVLATLGGHNLVFDVPFLKRLFRLSGKASSYRACFHHRSMDTSSLLRLMGMLGIAPLKEFSLSEGLRHFQITTPDRHTAYGDAIATGQLLTKIIETCQGAIGLGGK